MVRWTTASGDSVSSSVASVVVIDKKEAPLTSAEVAYRELRTAILSGRVAAGETMSQVQLAAQMQISRTPLREAVRRLESEGLLSSESNRRVRVSTLTLRDLDEVYGQRLLLEPLAVHLSVPRLDRADLRALNVALEASTTALRTGDLDLFHEHHRALHLGLVGRVGERLLHTISDLWDHAERYRRVFLVEDDGESRRERSIHDHEDLVRAAEARDSARCAAVLVRHLSTTALTIFDYYGGPERPDMINRVLDRHD